ncbi:MAG: HPr(Ser) kinase/phosphatase, partial [Candidatus Cloacimonetes bacterium]|nr:HPr(Ser) kinase/phosphatase [Candidatus Cloacimonadota bacterium]
TNSLTLENIITEPHINKPGLALAGFHDLFDYKRVQILGETEIHYMESLKKEVLYQRLRDMFDFAIPCIIISKGLSLPYHFEELANEKKIAIFSSRLSTDILFYGLHRFFRNLFAPERSIHGTLVDVFGAGVFITGESGMGKSESALDLVERGHRLVSDDMVRMILKDDYIIGTSVNNCGYFMELRGAGIIDVEKMFGVEAVRMDKRVDLQVHLVSLTEANKMQVDRLNERQNFVNILGVNIPYVILPVSSGKNTSVVIEVIAMNHILHLMGYDANEVFSKRQREQITKKSRIRKNISIEPE